MSVSPELTTNELIHLAILDSRLGRHDEAILKLKRCLASAPGEARAHYLLAAEHAQLGMYSEAASGFESALALDSSLLTARFQLGLLHAVNHQPAKAHEAWAQIGDLPAEPLSRFTRGLECALDGDASGAIRHLDEGLAMAAVNPTLHNDMAQLKARLLGNLAKDAEGAGPAGEILLKSYKGTGGEPDA